MKDRYKDDYETEHLTFYRLDLERPAVRKLVGPLCPAMTWLDDIEGAWAATDDVVILKGPYGAILMIDGQWRATFDTVQQAADDAERRGVRH